MHMWAPSQSGHQIEVAVLPVYFHKYSWNFNTNFAGIWYNHVKWRILHPLEQATRHHSEYKPLY